eukprot:445426_1
MQNNNCYGLLVDVSGSMQKALQSDDIKSNDESINRMEAVFKTIIKTLREIIDDKQDDQKLNQQNQVFALAFGLSDAEHQHCDLISLFKHLSTSYDTKSGCIQKLKTYGINHNFDKYIQSNKINNNQVFKIIGHEPLIKMAEQNGAPYAGFYIKKYLKTPQEAGFLFQHFYHHPKLLSCMINSLPNACKSGTQNVALGAVSMIGFSYEGLESKSAGQALKKAECLVLSPIYNIVKRPMCGKEIIKILDKLSMIYVSNDANKENHSIEVKRLTDDVKKYIYGGTPMCQSIQYAQRIFELKKNNKDNKILCIISDGDATDDNPLPFANKLRNENNVTIISCFITNKHIENPRKLHDVPVEHWKPGALTLFEMSSFVSNMHSGLSYLLKRGWEIPLSGQCKLFVQANHPNIIEEFCGIINRFSQSTEEITKFIGNHVFDKYINCKICHTEAPQQEGGTCFANSIATVFHLAMSSIIGRDGGIPKFESLREEIIDAFKKNGAKTRDVLTAFCPKYRLCYEKIIAESDARKIVCQRRPMVFIFRLYQAQWVKFKKFYANNGKGILTSDDLKIEQEEKKLGNTGHAVVFIRCEPNCLVFMNSWGIEFADHGFFRVKTSNVLHVKTRPAFYDVRPSKFTYNEQQRYKEYCKNKTKSMIDNYVPTAMYNTRYKCPKCGNMAKLNEYLGDFMNAICRKCNGSFNPNAVGLVKSWEKQQIMEDTSDYLGTFQQLLSMGFEESISLQAAKTFKQDINRCLEFIAKQENNQ